MKRIALLFLIGVFPFVASAQEVEIQTFESAGKLTFNEVPFASDYTHYRVEWSSQVSHEWTNLWDGYSVMSGAGSGIITATVPMYFRVVAITTPPQNMDVILSGTNEGVDPDIGQYSLAVNPFFIGQYEVTGSEWDEVRNWAITNGYSDLTAGTRTGHNHPIRGLNAYEAMKWCNALSEYRGLIPAYYTDSSDINITTVYRTGNVSISNEAVLWNSGYRLPTPDEWHYAARGGVANTRFYWGDAISHSNANFRNDGGEFYAIGTTGYHPDWAESTSPVGSFEPNGYGLYDIIGNVGEIVWFNQVGTGPDSGFKARGGDFRGLAAGCRLATQYSYSHASLFSYLGLRIVLSPD